jgi:site-specific recombinase XerD
MRQGLTAATVVPAIEDSQEFDDVCIHDLRHSFASFLVNAGRSLYEVQKILGHTQVKTTQRYAHLSPDTLIDAANAAMDVVGV